MRKILILTEAGDAYPSGKVRAFIYKDLFASRGYQVRYKSCMFPFIFSMYNSNDRFFSLFRWTGIIHLTYYLNLKIIKPINIFIIPFIAQRYDVIYLQKILSWKLVEKISRTSKARLVYDVNDGLWLPIWERSTGGKINSILQLAHAVTCDNPFGLSYSKKLNDNCFLVPDSPLVELFDLHRKRSFKGDTTLTIGWVGSPSTLFNLFLIWEPLETLFSRHKNIHLRIIGGGTNPALLPCFENVRYSVKPYYSQEDLVEEVLKMDIGLFPLFDVDNSRARGILKATVYMSGEVAVVSSPVGQSAELIQDGVNGMLASTNKEWEEKLELLLSDVLLRKKIGAQGLATVRAGFTVEKNFNKLIQVFENV
jgi:glycosyltransferase involved in cell wall biosynthesis